MQIHRSIVRRQLDHRLTGLADAVGACPPHGWAKTIRRALGMTTGDLAQRLAVSQSRAKDQTRSQKISWYSHSRLLPANTLITYIG